MTIGFVYKQYRVIVLKWGQHVMFFHYDITHNSLPWNNSTDALVAPDEGSVTPKPTVKEDHPGMFPSSLFTARSVFYQTV